MLFLPKAMGGGGINLSTSFYLPHLKIYRILNLVVSSTLEDSQIGKLLGLQE